MSKPPPQMCQREGCRRLASSRDEFCSTHCAKVFYGTAPKPVFTKYERRKIRKQVNDYGPTVDVANTDAMTRRAAGSFESGKRR